MQNNQIHKADVLLAAALVVGGIFVATIATGTGSSIALIPSAYADTNCDEADLEFNDQGHFRGNPKQCVNLLGGTSEGEQPRSCRSPNGLKDTDGDSFAYCVTR